eukprot:jgi/Tetstr1/454089/TSEL_041008.t1
MNTFVHPTKTGSTAVEEYFRRHHPRRVRGVGHIHTCANSQNPIVIIREPMERFVSMFSYWRNGAADGRYRRDPDWVDVDTISEFVGRLRAKDRGFERDYLHRDFTTSLHFEEQRHWLKPADHAKTIVVVYDRRGLEEKLRALLAHLGLPPVGLPLPRVNVTKTSARVDCTLSEEDRAWVRERFREDFRLWHLVTRHPHRFKKVF